MTSARLRLLTVVGALTLACGSDGDTPQDDGTTSGVDTDVADSSGTSPSSTAPSTTDNRARRDSERHRRPTRRDPNWERTSRRRDLHTAWGATMKAHGALGLDTYEEARTGAEASAIQVQERLMPPWHAVETDECQPPLAFSTTRASTTKRTRIARRLGGHRRAAGLSRAGGCASRAGEPRSRIAERDGHARAAASRSRRAARCFHASLRSRSHVERVRRRHAGATGKRELGTTC